MNEFIVSHAPSFTQKAGRDRPRPTARPSSPHAGPAEGKPRLLPRRPAPHAGTDRSVPRRRLLPFPRIEGLKDSFAFCRRLLQETKVGIAPGVAFGTGGEGSVRICYAAERSILEPAMERLQKFLHAGRWSGIIASRGERKNV